MSVADFKHRILIAADNPTQAALLESCLVNMNCEISFATDGRETLDQAASLHPDLIVLDLAKGEPSQVAVCRQLKQDTSTREIRVIALIALNTLRDIEKVVDAGTDEFLSKPVDKVQLVQRVRCLLGR